MDMALGEVGKAAAVVDIPVGHEDVADVGRHIPEPGDLPYGRLLLGERGLRHPEPFGAERAEPSVPIGSRTSARPSPVSTRTRPSVLPLMEASRTWSPTCLRTQGSADMLRERRGLLLDLAGRAKARDAAAAWTARVHAVTARTDRQDVDALLIRPDGLVAGAWPTGRDFGATTLVRVPGTWFSQPA